MGPLSSSQVLALAREAMRVAHENEAKAAQASGVGDNLKPGLTVDLSRKRIEVLPEEIVDIIKDELERYAHAPPPPVSGWLGADLGLEPADSLALSHNQLQTFPSRFVECTSLRYLNVRQNDIREFPLAVSPQNQSRRAVQ